LQLQMTGYMFRNAEYVLALRRLMNLQASVTLSDYKMAFDNLDTDRDGYIGVSEIKTLLDQAYTNKPTPAFEIQAFIEFFDKNKDGRVSWQEFQVGLGTAMASSGKSLLLKEGVDDEEDDDDEDDDDDGAYGTSGMDNVALSGTIELELENGKVVEVEAQEVIASLQAEAEALRRALAQEKYGVSPTSPSVPAGGLPMGASPSDAFGSITSYIASRQGDLKTLTEGISTEIVETMQKLAKYVVDVPVSARKKDGSAMDGGEGSEVQIQMAGASLQQLALWQLVLGYRLREMEATGEYLGLQK
jgi:EF-hand domain pair/Protein of unknown function (DUF760)